MKRNFSIDNSARHYHGMSESADRLEKLDAEVDLALKEAEHGVLDLVGCALERDDGLRQDGHPLCRLGLERAHPCRGSDASLSSPLILGIIFNGIVLRDLHIRREKPWDTKDNKREGGEKDSQMREKGKRGIPEAFAY